MCRRLHVPVGEGSCRYQRTRQSVHCSLLLSLRVADKRAARNKMEREFGWLLDPVTKGDYPEVLKQSIGSDLPSFTEREKADLKGSIDFIGVNVYTAR